MKGVRIVASTIGFAMLGGAICGLIGIILGGTFGIMLGAAVEESER